jgi:hypothetical protein
MSNVKIRCNADHPLWICLKNGCGIRLVPGTVIELDEQDFVENDYKNARLLEKLDISILKEKEKKVVKRVTQRAKKKERKGAKS